MSHIITYLKCEKCNHELNNIYISLGHPEKNFIWKWECPKCNHINGEKIPRYGLSFLDEEYDDTYAPATVITAIKKDE